MIVVRVAGSCVPPQCEDEEPWDGNETRLSRDSKIAAGDQPNVETSGGTLALIHPHAETLIRGLKKKRKERKKEFSVVG